MAKFKKINILFSTHSTLQSCSLNREICRFCDIIQKFCFRGFFLGNNRISEFVKFPQLSIFSFSALRLLPYNFLILVEYGSKSFLFLIFLSLEILVLLVFWCSSPHIKLKSAGKSFYQAYIALL